MDNPNEIDMDISKSIDGIDPMTVELIRMSERIKIFSKLRNLIYEKQYEHDNDAADLLGWAYEKLVDQTFYYLIYKLERRVKIKKIPGSYSESGQESFVINQLKEKKHGYYVEIGAYHPTRLSNTYLLETQYDWSGVGLEINRKYTQYYNQQRRNRCLDVDATSYDLRPYFIENEWPKQIDYLQLDIEPAHQTLAALLNLPMDYRYSVITFEHDRYTGEENEQHQQSAYDFLTSHGYKRVVHNMRNYEDWYIDPTVIDCEFLGKDVNQGDLFT